MKKSMKNGIFQYKPYWIITVVILAITYGFLLTNQSIGIDDENFRYYFDNYGIAASGRYGYVILMKIFNTYAYLPVWRDTIALILLLIGSTIWCNMFQYISCGKISSNACIIFSSLLLTYPLLGKMYVYISINIEVSLVLLLGGAAAYVTFLMIYEKRKVYFWCIILMLILGMSLIENCLNYYLCGIFMGILIENIYPNEMNGLQSKNTKGKIFSAFKLVCISCIIIIIGMAINAVLSKVINYWLDLDDLVYTAKFISWNFDDFYNSLVTLIRGLCTCFIQYFSEYFYFKVYIFALFLMLVLGFIYSIRRKNVTILLAGVGVIATTFVFYIITGNSRMVTRTFVVYAVFVAFVFMLLYELTEYKYLKMIMIMFSVWVVFYQSRELNTMFADDYNRFQKDRDLAVRINDKIEETYGGIPGLPVVFIGQPLVYAEYPNIEDDVNMRSIFENADGDSIRIHRFFKMLGYNYENPMKEEITIYNTYEMATNRITENAKEVAKQMPIWPKEGSVKVTDEAIVVKLGPLQCQSYDCNLDGLKDILGASKNEKAKGLIQVARIDILKSGERKLYVKGEACFDNLSSIGTRISVVLSNESKSYVLSTDQFPVESEECVSKEYSNSNNLNGFSLYQDIQEHMRGKWEVSLLLNNGKHCCIVDGTDSYICIN